MCQKGLCRQNGNANSIMNHGDTDYSVDLCSFLHHKKATK